MKRTKKEDVGLGNEEGVGTAQKIRTFLVPATTHLAYEEGQTPTRIL